MQTKFKMTVLLAATMAFVVAPMSANAKKKDRANPITCECDGGSPDQCLLTFTDVGADQEEYRGIVNYEAGGLDDLDQPVSVSAKWINDAVVCDGTSCTTTVSLTGGLPDTSGITQNLEEELSGRSTNEGTSVLFLKGKALCVHP